MTAGTRIRPASTVVLLRDGARGPEVCLVQRRHEVAFMAGAHVFPGGRVEPSDAEATDDWCDVPAPGALARGPALDFWVAAAREVFEETGVLLARPRAHGARAPIDATERERLRTALHGARCHLRDVMEQLDLRLTLDALVPFAHWVTPPLEIRRFDAWFFLARAPQHGPLPGDGVEVHGAQWLRPSDALARAAQGQLRLPPPTWTTLREIEGFVTIDAALAWAASRAVVARQPALVEEHGTRIITLPPSADPGGTIGERRFVLRDGRWIATP